MLSTHKDIKTIIFLDKKRHVLMLSQYHMDM